MNYEEFVDRSLEALARDTDSAEAPPELKSTLRRAFDQHHAAPVSKVVELKTFRFNRRSVYLIAAAASVIALLGLTYKLWIPVFSSGEKQIIVDTERPSSSPSVAVPQPGESESRMAADLAPEEKITRRSSSKRAAASEDADPVETEFIPLTYVSDSASMQSGTVIRVEVLRATLMAMGLPINAALGDSLIKAELVVGDDGVARAIRFIQ
jgi:hypothetical protein